MTNNDQKIVVLQDYIKARSGLFKKEDVEAALMEQRVGLRDLDFDVLYLSIKKHKLKDAQYVKTKSVKIEHDLVIISNWLEDEITEATDEKDKEAKQILLKQCKKLSSTLERVKRNIEADLATCRFEIFKPLTVAGFLAGAPISAATLTGFFTKNPVAILSAMITGAALGVSLVFHYHAKTVGEFAKVAIVKSPHQVRFLRKSARNSMFATVLTFSVAAKQVNDIEPRVPMRPMVAPHAVNAANML